MSDTSGCEECARFCTEQSLMGSQLSDWMRTHELGSDDGCLEGLYLDQPMDRAGVTGAFKCRYCGQTFVLEVGKRIVAGNELSVEWKVLPPGH